MVAMMLILINFNNAQPLLKFISANIIAAICWPPPLILQLFSPRLFKAAPFSQLGCFCVDINNRLKSKVSLRFVVSYVQPITQQYESTTVGKHLCNQSSHYEKYRRFPYEGKPSCAITKLTLFAVSKDEWDTKEDTGKFMKSALYILWYAKRHLADQNDIKQ